MAEYLVVLSSPHSVDGASSFVSSLSRLLVDRSVDHLIIPSLYCLEPTSKTVARLKEESRELVLCCWLAPRAAQWTAAALGVTCTDCLDLASYSEPQAALAVLEEQGYLTDGRGHRELLAEETTARWYPVIDYERCVVCGQCREFCLFEVYEQQGDSIVVSRPERCKPGCPACARVCPAGAIMFPLYEDDPSIAGGAMAAPESASKREKNDGIDDLISKLDELEL